MRKYNSNFQPVWGDRKRDPKPFPGMFPTRWKISVSWRDGVSKKRNPTKTWAYLGKPNARLARSLVKNLQIKYGNIQVQEFDRGGLIQSATSIFPTLQPLLNINDWVQRIARFYYPWSNTHLTMFDFWANNMNYRLKLKKNNKSFVVYSQYLNHKDVLQEHIAWLNTQNFQWK